MTAAAAAIAIVVHVVVAGDTLGDIARDHGSTVARIAAANAIPNPDRIRVGQRLRIPLPTGEAATVAPNAAQCHAMPDRCGIAAGANNSDPLARHFPLRHEKARRVVLCESGGDWAVNTGNGYYGGWQFDLATWRSVDGAGLPSDASADEQTMRARILWERRGWQPWPKCGLR